MQIPNWNGQENNARSIVDLPIWIDRGMNKDLKMKLNRSLV